MGKAAAKKKLTTTGNLDDAERYFAAFQAKQRFIGAAMNLGWRLAVTFLIPVALGAWLDKRYDSSPSYTLTGMFIAIAASAMVITRTVKEVNEETESTTRRRRVK
jgi:predicted F0F1-ATPase subunit